MKARMTTAEFVAASKKPATLSVEMLQIPVNVVDHQVHLGREELKVTPIGGYGESWVERDRVSLSSPDEVIMIAGLAARCC